MSLLDFLRPQGAQMPGAMSQPRQSGFSQMMQPEVLSAMAGQLLGQNGNMQNIGNAFAAAGPVMAQNRETQAQRAQQNKTYDFFKTQAPEYAQMIEAGMPISDAWKQYTEQRFAQPKSPQVETFYNDQGQSYKAQWDGKDWVPVGGAKGEEGFEITTADGTTIRQGAFGNQDKKNVANRITAEQDAAASASSLKATVAMLRKANQNTGYSGPGGGVVGGIDDTAEQIGLGGIIPGNARARATMRSGGVDIVLANVQKMKGAVSDKETAMLMGAAPGMAQTPEGNTALLDIADAMADRQLARVKEMETWRQQYGTLDGFEAAWGEWVAQNPLLADDGNGSVALAGGGTPAGGQPPARRKFNPATGRIE